MSKIVSIKRVKNNKLQAELVDVVNTSGRINVLQKLNKGDEAFRQGSLRHAWFPVTIMSLYDLGFPADILKAVDALKYGESVKVNFESPKIEGQELCIQITESIIPANDYERQSTLKAAKQLAITPEVAKNKNMPTDYELSKYIGQTGYFMHHGAFIFARAGVTVKSQLQHTILDAKFVPSAELADYGAILHEPTVVDEKEFAEEEEEDKTE
jgi:hypothetical protein